MKEKELKQLWLKLLKNEKLVIKNNNYKGMQLDFFKPIIHWQNYGSSAEKLNYTSFKWLITTIFKDYSFIDFE